MLTTSQNILYSMRRDTVVSMPVTDPSPRTGSKYLKIKILSNFVDNALDL
jgi:hypothetical protein